MKNNYYKMNLKERAVLNKVMEATMTDYEVEKLFVPVENLMIALEDLLVEYHRKEEELEDVIQDRDDNWRPIPYEEQI